MSQFKIFISAATLCIAACFSTQAQIPLPMAEDCQNFFLSHEPEEFEKLFERFIRQEQPSPNDHKAVLLQKIYANEALGDGSKPFNIAAQLGKGKWIYSS